MRVLLVEDEPLLLVAASNMLEELGHQVCGMATSLGSAMQAAETLNVDIAVLDVNIGGDRIDGVATLLASRGIPFVFTTGYGIEALPTPFAGRPYLTKPFDFDQLGHVVDAAYKNRATSN